MKSHAKERLNDEEASDSSATSCFEFSSEPLSASKKTKTKQSSFDEPDTTARTVVAVCLGLVGVLMVGNVALWYLAQKSATADGTTAKGAPKKISKKKLKRETLRRGLPMPE